MFYGQEFDLRTTGVGLFHHSCGSGYLGRVNAGPKYKCIFYHHHTLLHLVSIGSFGLM